MFLAEGSAGLRQGHPGPPPDLARRAQVTAALDALLGQDYAWTAAQLATALRAQDRPQHAPDAQVPGPDGRALAAHRGPHAAAQARPRPRCPRPNAVGHAQKKAAAGRIVLTYLDECGFSPSLPVNYSWVRAHERKLVPYENPQGRHLNALAALDRGGPLPGLYWVTKAKALVADDLLRFLQALPPVPAPRVVVLDHASMHRNTAVRAARPALWAKRIYRYYLPPSSPELNVTSSRCSGR
ncbi:MAG: transposase [Dehalococcoidia bacterium]